jgi:hypothetical protein
MGRRNKAANKHHFLLVFQMSNNPISYTEAF